MRVLAACSLGGAGHLRPLLPMLAASRADGHEVMVAGPATVAELVHERHLPFRACRAPSGSVVDAIVGRLPGLAREEAATLADRELFGRLATEAMLPDMDALCREIRPDLILREPCEYSSAIVAARLRLPVAQVGISAATIEWQTLGLVAPVLDRHSAGIVDAIRRAPYVTAFPASLDPSPFPATMRCRDGAHADLAPVPSWWGESTAPLIYLTFGTVLGRTTIAGELYRSALRALEGLDARVLLAGGRDLDVSTLGEVPPHVHVEPWVEPRRILAEAQLVVCHGGSGTVLGALAMGVPVVAVPAIADQFENAKRVAERGAGIAVELERGAYTDEAGRIGLAVRRALGPDVRRRAQELAVEMADAPDCTAVLADLLRASPRS